VEEYRSELMTAMRAGKSASWVVEQSDGRAIAVSNRPFAGGYLVGTHEDISGRRRGGREVERTKSFLDRVIETVPATIVVKNAQDLRFVLVNRAGERLYGVPRDRLIGKCADEIFSPDAARYITENDHALVKAGQETVTDQHSIETPANGDR